MNFAWNITLNVFGADSAPLSPSGSGPCLGFRKPGQPYEWISYTEVRWKTDACRVSLHLFFSLCTCFLILRHLCASCSAAFGWLSFFHPAGGGEGTSSGFWAPGQRLQAQPGAVCGDLCTEQTRGMRRDQLPIKINWLKRPPPPPPLPWSFTHTQTNTRLKMWFVFPGLSSLSALKCVLNVFTQDSCPWWLRSPSRVSLFCFNVSGCQTKSLLSLLCRLIVFCSIRAFHLWNYKFLTNVFFLVLLKKIYLKE